MTAYFLARPSLHRRRTLSAVFVSAAKSANNVS